MKKWSTLFLVLSLALVVTTSGLQITTQDMSGIFQREMVSTNSSIIIGTTHSVEFSLDPAQSYDLFGWQMIQTLSSGLVQIRPGSQAGLDDIIPSLAESWTVDGSGLIWDFNLRDNIVFESGAPFNASCVKYSFDRNIGLALEDGPQLNIGYAEIINEIVVVSEYTVRFNLSLPYFPFLQLLSCPASFIVDPEYAPIDDFVHFAEGDARASHPNALGPYLLSNWTRVGGSDSMMRLAKNPGYWNVSDEMVDSIIIQFYSSDIALAAALMAGEIDIAYRELSIPQIQSFMTNPDFRVWQYLNPKIQFLCFNQDFYPYNETLIRQGIAAAFNRTYLANTVFHDTVDPLYSVIPAGLEYHKPSFEVFGEANYTYTRLVLGMYGYNETNKLNVNLYFETSSHYPQSTEQALVYEDSLEASGVISVDLTGVDWPTYRMYRNEGLMPVFMYGWYPDISHADNFGFLPFASWLNLGYNLTYPAGGVAQYSLWLEGRSANTISEARAAYHALQDLQASECSIIPLWQGRTYIVSEPKIDGIIGDITNLWFPWLFRNNEFVSSSTSNPTSSETSSSSTSSTHSSSTTSTTSTTANNASDYQLWEFMSVVITIGSIVVILIIVVLTVKARKT